MYQIISDYQQLIYNTPLGYNLCRTPFLKECPQHHGHKKDPGVTPGTCGAIGERAQVILVWVRPQGVENTSHPQIQGVTRVIPRALDGSWRCDSRMPKNTSMEVWVRSYGVLSGALPRDCA